MIAQTIIQQSFLAAFHSFHIFICFVKHKRYDPVRETNALTGGGEFRTNWWGCYFASTVFFRSIRPVSKAGPTMRGMATASHLPMKSPFWPVMRQVTRVSSPTFV